MSDGVIPILKIGTPFQIPSWRYDALKNPGKYGFNKFFSLKRNNSGYLKRMITKGVETESSYSFPIFFSNLSKKLPTNLSLQLDKIYTKYYYKTNKLKITFESITNKPGFISWNIKKIKTVNDEWFKKLVLHVFNFYHDESIEYALNIYLNPQNNQIKKFIGYAIFSGLSDNEIAKQWKILPKRITALRYIFFDYSFLPKDKVAQWAILKQLVDNGEIKRQEFNLYKKIFEMDGYLGVKAFITPYHLSDSDKEEVKDYLNESAIVNTLMLNYNINSKGDVLAYGNVISNLANLKLRQEEIQAKKQEIELLKLQTQRLSNELNDVSISDRLTEEDALLLQTSIRALSKYDSDVELPSFREIINKVE